MSNSFLRLFSAWLLAVSPTLLFAGFPIPKSLGSPESQGIGIQRTMNLLATSTPTKRNTVRILIYGQSITEQEWTKTVIADLRSRFPNANLIAENRAIGGHSSQILWKTAEADLYSFQPDLMIFYVYGDHNRYTDIIRRTRERTCAEILLLSDHFNADARLDEETDASKLSMSNWTPWFSHSFLPKLAKEYRCGLVDQRNLWRQYLTDFGFQPSALLTDSVHLNAHGNFLMAELVKAYLVHRPVIADPNSSELVKTVPVGSVANGKTSLKFSGNRIDAVVGSNATAGSGASSTYTVKIDGASPSSNQGCYAFTKSTGYAGTNWPCLLRAQRGPNPLQIEEWTLILSDFNDDYTKFRFQLSGSKTGEDGEGTAEKKFVSRSGRIVIEPDDWNLAYCKKVYQKLIHNDRKVRFSVVPLFKDTIEVKPTSDATTLQTITLAQGLSNSEHRLELSASDSSSTFAFITGFAVYKPAFMQTEPLAPDASQGTLYQPPSVVSAGSPSPSSATNSIAMGNSAVPAKILYDGSQTLLFVYGAWEGKVKSGNGPLKLTDVQNRGGAGFNEGFDLSAHGPNKLGLKLKVGAGNKMPGMRATFRDTDGNVGSWDFDIPSDSTGKTLVLFPRSNATLEKPNETDSGKPAPSLSKIMQLQFSGLGDWSAGVPADIEIEHVGIYASSKP